MPRKPKGGMVPGTPGKAYPNRKDLNSQVPRAAPKGQAYGKAGAQLARQAAVPLAAARPPGQGGGGAPVAGQQPASRSLPQVTPLGAPTEFPDEPVTAGMALGPGPGPSARPGFSVIDDLRALYTQFPVEDLREILEELEESKGL